MKQLSLLLVVLALPSMQTLEPAEVAQFRARSHTEGNTGIQGTVTLTDEGASYRIRSNGIPDHSTGTFPDRATNPNSIEEQSLSYSFPKSPTVAASPTCLPPGPIGISTNGVPIFNPNNIDGNDAVNGPHAEVFDSCQGHPDMFGTYHYHQEPGCVSNNGNNELVGVALDGFPIYGPKDSDGRTITNNDLDNCHGRMENGNYCYRITADYPYVMACFKGTPSSDIQSRQLTSPQCKILEFEGMDSAAERPLGTLNVQVLSVLALVASQIL